MENSKQTDKPIKNRYFLRGLIFVIIGFLMLFCLQTFMIPRWNYPDFAENISYSLHTFYNQDKNKDEVLFLGTSHIQYGVSPMKFYEQSKVTSYNLGTSGQPISLSYYLLESAFETQSPKVVVLDASGLFLPEERFETAWKYVIPCMPDGWNKLRTMAYYAGVTGDRSRYGSKCWTRFFNILFPITEYHMRWKELKQEDFVDRFADNNNVFAGQFVYTLITSSGITADRMNEIAGMLLGDSTGWTDEFFGMQNKTSSEETVLYSTAIPESNEEWLRKIADLCNAHGSELLLIKVPTIQSPVVYTSAWTKNRSEIARKAAQEIGITYWDLLYDANLSLDPETDFSDGGGHLNYRGANKVTQFLADYIPEQYMLERTDDPVYDNNMLLYKKLSNIARLQTETGLPEYLRLLDADIENYAVCMACCDDMKAGLTDKAEAALAALGLRTDFENVLKYQNAFIALIDGGEVIYEGTSNRRMERLLTLTNQEKILVTSSGYKTGARASMQYRNVEYAGNIRGINIVVIDKETGRVVDQVVFDTGDENRQTATHFNMLKNFNEYWLYEKDKGQPGSE